MRVFSIALAVIATWLRAGVAFADGLEVSVSGPGSELVRAAIERETSAIDPAPRGKITIRRDAADLATVVYDADDGRHIERTLEVQSDASQAADEIALVAASLARDDAGPPPATPSATPSPTSKPAPSRSPAPVPAKTASEKATKQAPPKPSPPCRGRTPFFRVGFDFLPYVGTSSAPSLRSAPRGFAFSALGGLGGGLSGLGLAGLFDVETGYVCGVQLTGLVSLVRGGVRGFQMGGIADYASGHVSGVQLGGIVNIAGDGLSGVQIAPINVVKGRARGVQIGLVNVAEKSDLSIGLVSVNTRGRTQLDLWSEVEVGLIAFAVKHGGDHWHAFYGVATRLTQPSIAGVFGLGGHVRFNRRLFLDVDTPVVPFASFNGGKPAASLLLQARPVLGVNVINELAIVFGATYNVLFARGSTTNWSPGYAFDLGSEASASVHMWPGAMIGLEALSDRGPT